MISYSNARTMKNIRYRVLLLSFGMIIGFVYNALARTHLTLEEHTAEIVKLDVGVTEIFVADPEIADIQLNNPTAAYVYGKKAGRTTVVATDKKGQTLVQIDVEVVHNISALKRSISSVYPKEQVQIISTPDGIVLQGEVTSAKASKDIVNIAKRYVSGKQPVVNDLKISTPTQVYLRVKVAEVNRTVLNQLDINWGARADIGSFTMGLLTGRAPLTTAGSFVRNASTPPLNSIGFRGTHSDSLDVTALLDALNQEGLSSILAEPNLVCISGDTAQVLVGGEFPYPVPQDQSITIEFKQFGISLAFTPTILSGSLINLRVRPEVSELDFTTPLRITLFGSTAEVPAIKTRRAETSVEIGSGDSLAIAGLFSNTMSNTLKEVPGLADIPILGALFRSAKFQRNETELVIIVTPYLVQPVSNKKLQTPNEGLKYASFLETILLNRLNRHDPVPVEPCIPPCKGGNMTANVAYTPDDSNSDQVIFEQPLTAVSDGTEISAADSDTFKQQEAIKLVGDAGFYIE